MGGGVHTILSSLRVGVLPCTLTQIITWSVTPTQTLSLSKNPVQILCLIAIAKTTFPILTSSATSEHTIITSAFPFPIYTSRSTRYRTFDKSLNTKW